MTVTVDGPRAATLLEDAFVTELDELFGTTAELSAAAGCALRQVLEALVREGLEPPQELAALRVLDALASRPPA